MSDDIAAWLTAIYDEQERSTRAALLAIASRLSGYEAEDSFELLHDRDYLAYAFHVPPELVLAWIAADREILAEHTRNAGRCDTCVTDVWVEYGDPVVGHHESYCPTVRHLAVPHASRPGYQEAWRP